MSAQPAMKYERALALHQKGKTNAQIAKAIGSPPNSVGGLLFYARNKRPVAVKHAPGSPGWWRARGY